MPPDTHNTDLHFHSTREECWYVRGGSGIARIGEEAHELRPGSFWLRRPNGGVGHRIEVGPDGMDLVTMGDLVPGRRRAPTRSAGWSASPAASSSRTTRRTEAATAAGKGKRSPGRSFTRPGFIDPIPPEAQ